MTAASRRRAFRLGLVFASTLAAVIAGPSAHASTPTVINGTPNPPLAGVAVYYETADSACTGSLLQPNVIVTAAHCLVDDHGNQTTQAADLTFWAPGVNVATSNPTSIKAVQIILNPAFANKDDQTGLDIAYFVLDGPLGTPIITRVATQSEVVALAARQATLSQVGYGLTGPRNDPSSQTSDVPVGMSAAIDSDYAGGSGSLEMKTNGVTGTCAGDSGSPWLYQANGETLLISVLSSGDNPPCEPAADSGTHDYTAVVAGQGSLLAQAQGATGLAPAPTPVTCLKAKGAKPSCAEGTTWTYDFCWTAPRWQLEQFTGKVWQRVSAGKGAKYASCGRKNPYRVLVTGDAAEGSSKYRIMIPRQAGVGRPTYDPFTVTSA